MGVEVAVNYVLLQKSDRVKAQLFCLNRTDSFLDALSNCGSFMSFTSLVPRFRLSKYGTFRRGQRSPTGSRESIAENNGFRITERATHPKKAKYYNLIKNQKKPTFPTKQKQH